MLVALVVILLTFNILSGGKLIQPTNMVTMAVQATGIAIIATGMVLVIVSRNIDLSVGSLVGLIAMVYALLMTDWLTAILGSASDFPFRWVIALLIGVGLGAVVGGIQGFIIAYIGVPSFIVTLGGLLSIRGLVWYLSSGAAVSGLDPDFQQIGGGGDGLDRRTADLGPRHRRLRRDRRAARQRPASAAPLRLPAPADVGGGPARRWSAALIVLGLAWFANNNFWPGLASRRSQTLPPGGCDPTGSRSSSDRRHAGDDLHREPAPLRALRLRLRRQPRRGRAGRHQHPLDDPQDLRPDGHPVRPRRRRSRRPASTAPPSTSARATSSTSSRRRSSAGRRSPAASGPSRAPSSARS